MTAASATHRSERAVAWPLLAALLLLGAVGGAALAYLLTRGDGGSPDGGHPCATGDDAGSDHDGREAGHGHDGDSTDFSGAVVRRERRGTERRGFPEDAGRRLRGRIAAARTRGAKVAGDELPQRGVRRLQPRFDPRPPRQLRRRPRLLDRSSRSRVSATRSTACARTLKEPLDQQTARTEGISRATRPPKRVRGLCPRTLSAKRRNQNRAKAQLSPAELSPAPPGLSLRPGGLLVGRFFLGWKGHFGSHLVLAAELEAAL